jgi:iron complex transport system substrate-binding protein
MLRRRPLLGLGGLALLGPAAALASPAAAPRVVSIGGALTELIYALGAEQYLVGVDSTSLFPAAAQRLRQVGYARTLAAEGLLALSPSLIVATEEAGPPAVLRQLEAARVPLQLLRSDYRFEGVLARAERLGSLLGREAQARALRSRLQAEWAQAQTELARFRAAQGAAAPRVLFVMAHAPGQLRAAGQDTGAEAMLAYAGARNALQGAQGYKALSPEAAIAAAPDFILSTQQSLDLLGGSAGLLRQNGLAQTPAGQAGRVAAMDALELLGFGPRLPQALSRLITLIHGPAAAARA